MIILDLYNLFLCVCDYNQSMVFNLFFLQNLNLSSRLLVQGNKLTEGMWVNLKKNIYH